MLDVLIFFLYTFGISFIGTIPPGVVNFTAIRIGVEKGMWPSFFFSAGYTVVEMVYGLLAIQIIHYFMEYVKQIEFGIQLLSVPILLFFGIGTLRAKVSNADAMDEIHRGGSHYFRYGLKLGLLNPMALPYWITYCALSSKRFQEFNLDTLAAFEAGVGAGAISLLLIYARGGRELGSYLQNNGVSLNKWMGWLFILLSFVQLSYIVYNEFFG